MSETALKGFDQPDEVREFPNGRFQIVHIAGVSYRTEAEQTPVSLSLSVSAL